MAHSVLLERHFHSRWIRGWLALFKKQLSEVLCTRYPGTIFSLRWFMKFFNEVPMVFLKIDLVSPFQLNEWVSVSFRQMWTCLKLNDLCIELRRWANTKSRIQDDITISKRIYWKICINRWNAFSPSIQHSMVKQGLLSQPSRVQILALSLPTFVVKQGSYYTFHTSASLYMLNEVTEQLSLRVVVRIKGGTACRVLTLANTPSMLVIIPKVIFLFI